GQALLSGVCDEGGDEGRAAPRRRRLYHRVPGRAYFPRREADRDRRGHLRDPAPRHRPGDPPAHVSARPELIAVESVTKRYLTSSGPVEALHDVSLSVEAAAFCTLIGPSGCGKSPLLGMLGALVTPDQRRLLVPLPPITTP